MHSLRTFKKYSSVIWYSDSESLNQSLIDALEQNSFEVETALTEEDLKAKYQTISPTFFIIDHPKNIERSIQLVSSGKRHAANSTLTTILISDAVSAEDKDNYFDAEGDEILLAPVSSKELLYKVKHYQEQHKKQSEFSFQLEEASQMALLAMENSSDLGGILSFVKEAMVAKTYEELAEQIFSATHPYSDSAIVEIKGHDNVHYFSTSDVIDPDMKHFLLAQKNGDRLIKSGSILQVNNQNLVVLLDGLPIEDQDKIGRVSDTLVMLCDTANRFAESIAIKENLSKTDESRRRFLTTLSHELRTPLNGILGFSKTLGGRNEDSPIGKTGRYALEQIIEGTSQINEIITTLIEISNSSLGLNELAKRNIEVKELGKKLEADFKEQAQSKGLDFEITAPDDLSLLSEEKKVYSMLKHLVDNAVKFTKSGSISISFSTNVDPVTDQRVIFKVTDTGIGIDTKDHQRIFTELGQLNNEHNREHYGIGIGLYYVNLLCQQLGGKVSVDSSLGEGSTFILNLPSGEAPKETENQASNQEQEIDDLLF